METKYQTSFIPKKPVAVVGQSSSHGTSLFLVISIIIFLVSLGLGGYVYLSKNILIQQIEANQKKIEANKSGVISDTSEVENLVSLSSRINIAKQLLDKHVSIYPIFDFLQQGTLKSVRFKNFSFTSNGKNDSGINTVSIQLSGQARDWETVASQADEFGKPEWRNIINEPKMSNLSLGADGSISFTFTAQVTPGALVYKGAN
jgi:hypothetical protein